MLPETPPDVLIASADAETVHLLSALLDSMQCPVEVISDGMDALRRLNGEQPPRIALLDIDLPSMGGIEILSELRRREEQRSTWAMLMSESVDLGAVRTATDAGADDFLLKPVDEIDLRVRMRVAERVQALMSQLQREAASVRFHATHDNLTGTWNREAMLSLLFRETDRAQRMKTPLAMMLLDLDGFSQINLDFGYESGDRVLQELGARFRRFLRSYDLVGRCGEDEFLVALPGCTTADAQQMAKRITHAVLKKPFPVQRDLATLTASIGIAGSRGRSPLVVLREAERALANAKLSGKNCIRVYSPPEITEAPASDIPSRPAAEPVRMRISPELSGGIVS
ncbi:GGDEF domain-containing response regulator [Paracidobacterium acidisoli]|uniref:diguanylate cyclase n=1 Tax=Paracidobacterium acidisoli TaxID=2303751 RepID=A0A372IUA8_9BACT|nr:diguanylate cyclase [Paracidobacterium acidisoli]MBT9329949.1 diguanylate cyclase [Paracidobacterium acidisoli]